MREATGARRKVTWIMVIVLAVAACLYLLWALLWPKPPHVNEYVVRRQTLQNQIFTSGFVRPRMRQVINMTSLGASFSSFAVPIGASVKPNEVLIHTSNQAALAAWKSAQAAVNAASQQVKSATSGLLTGQIVAGEQLGSAQTSLAQAKEQAASAKAAYEATLVRAAFRGVVLSENPDGIDINGNPAPLMEVVSRDRMVSVELSQLDATEIRVGQRATITCDAYPNREWQAQVSYKAGFAAQTSSGGYQVEVDMTPRQSFSIPYGYQVNATVTASARRSVPVIPYAALVQNGAVYDVFVVQGHHVREIPVTLGITSNQVVQVTHGLSVGDAVVVNPPSGLVSGQKVIVS